MKTKTYGCAATTTALLFLATTSFGQLGLNVNSVTSATSTVNTSAINSAVSKSVAVTNAANAAIQRTSQASLAAISKVNNLKPQPNVKAKAGLSVASDFNAAGQNSVNNSNGNGNSTSGTSILSSGTTDVSVTGNVSGDKTKSNAGTASGANASGNNSMNYSNDNSSNGTPILTSGSTDVGVTGNVSGDKTKSDVKETKTKIHDGFVTSENAAKNQVKKTKQLSKENHSAEASASAKTQGEIKSK